MKLRDLTLDEHFPYARKQDLFNKQADYFVNKIMTGNNSVSIYKNMPTELVGEEISGPSIVDFKSPYFYAGRFIKNNWLPLTLTVIGGIVILYKINKAYKKTRKKYPPE